MRKQGRGLSSAARFVGVSPERLSSYGVRQGILEHQGRRWAITPFDTRQRVVPSFSKGKRVSVTVGGYNESRKAGEYMSAVGRAMETNSPEPLEPYIADGLRDIHHRYHPFEIRMNVLYRLTTEGPEPWEEIYRIVA